MVKVLLEVVDVVGQLLDHLVDFVDVEIGLLLWALCAGVSRMIGVFFVVGFSFLGVFHDHMISFFPLILKLSLQLIDLIGQFFQLTLINRAELFLMQLAILLNGRGKLIIDINKLFQLRGEDFIFLNEQLHLLPQILQVTRFLK